MAETYNHFLRDTKHGVRCLACGAGGRRGVSMEQLQTIPCHIREGESPSPKRRIGACTPTPPGWDKDPTLEQSW